MGLRFQLVALSLICMSKDNANLPDAKALSRWVEEGRYEDSSRPFSFFQAFVREPPWRRRQAHSERWNNINRPFIKSGLFTGQIISES